MDGSFILVFLEISVMIFIAAVVRSFISRYGFPLLVGEILAGILISPFAIGGYINQISGYDIFTINDFLLFLSEFSMILLIFASGLEHGISPLRKTGIWGFLGATLGAILPFTVATFVYYESFGIHEALFIGVSLGATSLAAAAAIIQELRIKSKGVDFLLSASALDDVVDLILLSIVIAIATSITGRFLINIFSLIAYFTISWLIILVTSVYIIPKIVNLAGDKYVYQLPFVLLFGLTTIMSILGFSPIISAFIAGVALAESYTAEKIRSITEVLLSVFGPIFFVVVGAQVNLLSINLQTFGFAIELTIIAILFKIIGVFPFAYITLKNFRAALSASIGMVPRGETGLVVASIGLANNFIDNNIFTGIVFMALFTTFVGSTIFKRIASWIID
jgi:Kef-type K+ transport systems, membrane components